MLVIAAYACGVALGTWWDWAFFEARYERLFLLDTFDALPEDPLAELAPGTVPMPYRYWEQW